jgi:hypothetical protein
MFDRSEKKKLSINIKVDRQNGCIIAIIKCMMPMCLGGCIAVEIIGKLYRLHSRVTSKQGGRDTWPISLL